MTKAQIEEFIPQLPHVQKWVAADTSGYKSEAKDRTGWESKKQLEMVQPLWETSGSF